MTRDANAYRPVFVLGTGRCGSTLVHEVLARHPDTGFVTNLDDLGLARSAAWQNQAWRRLPAGVTKKGGARFAPSEGYRALRREVAPLVVDPIRDLVAEDATPWLRDRMQRFVESRTGGLDAPVFLHKLTGWPRAGFLRACFPDARFLEIVRDGRAVANSWLQMPWWSGHRGPSGWHFGTLPPELDELWHRHDRSFPVLAALAWRLLMDSYEVARAEAAADRWLTVRYEDILAAPRERFGEVLDWLSLDWSEDFERGFGRYRFGSDRAAAFRRDLSDRDLVAIESVLGPRQAELGYR